MPTESLVHGDPDCHYKHMVAKVAPSVDPDAAIDVACFMTTDGVDGDNEVMLPDGIDLTRFDKNPVVMLCHSMGQPGTYYPLPVGKAEWTKKRPRGVLAGVRFTEKTPMGREVKELFADDMLRSFSVGFRPIEFSAMTRKEADSRPDWNAAFERTKGRVGMHRKWELLELSVAPIPSNPDALVVHYKSKGILVPKWLKFDSSKSHPMPESTPATRGGGACFDLACKSAAGDAGVSAADLTPADARVMIGLWLPPETASGLAVPGGDPPEDLHLTLCYLGRAIEIGTNAIERVKRMCADLAAYSPPLMGKIAGVGRFSASTTSDGKDVVYASADIPDLAEFRQRIAYALEGMGVAYNKAHGFTPHITLAYVDPDEASPVERIEPLPVSFDRFCLVIEGVRTDFPFNTAGFGYGAPVMAWRAMSDLQTKCPDGTDCDHKDMDEGDGMETMAMKPGDHVMHPKGCGRLEAVHTKGEHEGYGGMLAANTANPIGIVDPHEREGEKCMGKCMGNAKAFPMADLKPHVGEKAMSEGSGTAGGYAVKPDDEDEAKAAEMPVDDDTVDDDDPDGDFDEDDMDEAGGFKAGDHVTIRGHKSHGGYKGFGVVERLHKSGHVADVDNDMMATPDEPAARVKCYRKKGDGHVPTDMKLGVKCKCLTKMDTPMMAPSKKLAEPIVTRPTVAATKAAPAPEFTPLPPIVVLSDQEIQRQLAAQIGEIPRQVNAIVEKYLGVV